MVEIPETTAARSWLLACSFEGELLLQLLLEKWHHPFAAEKEFAERLLEAAADVLHCATFDSKASEFIQGLPVHHMNFVAAIWYVERLELAHDPTQVELRQGWLDQLQSTLPGCFCHPNDLF